MTFADKFWELTAQAGSVVITSHKSPDDDAIASVLAMYWIVTKKFPEKKVEMVYTGEASGEAYGWLANFDNIRFVDDVCEEVSGFDLVILVDASRKDRLGTKTEKLDEYTGRIITIDHHPDAENGFDLKLVDTEKISTAEIILEELAGDVQGMDRELAKIFLVGILGDAGNLSFVLPKNGQVFEIVRQLLAKLDMSVQKFTMEYAAISGREFTLVQELVKNTEFVAEKNGWPKYQYAWLSRETVEQGGYSEPEVSRARTFYTEKFYPWVDGYRLLLVFTPRDQGNYHASIRSVAGGISAKDLAKGMGLGNGHDVSAAMHFSGNGQKVAVQSAIEKVKRWMETNRP